MRILAGLTALLLAAALVGCGGPDRPPAAPDSEERQPPEIVTPWRGEGNVIEFSVWELHCPGCELEVEEAVKALPGVASARADWESSVVRIELDDSTSRDAAIPLLREAVHASGRLVLGEDERPQ